MFFRLHEMVNLIVQIPEIPDVFVEFVQMGEQFLHDPALERRENAVEVVQNLSFRHFEMIGNHVAAWKFRR